MFKEKIKGKDNNYDLIKDKLKFVIYVRKPLGSNSNNNYLFNWVFMLYKKY